MQESPSEQQARLRLLDKVIRELGRAESQAIGHAPREVRRIGDCPPTHALFEVGRHALAMRARLRFALEAHDLGLPRPHTPTGPWLRHVVARVTDGERAFRGALLDLRHGTDIVRVLRDVAHASELFALIRWCDDWLAVRRALVDGVEAQLVWFTAARTARAAHAAHAPQVIVQATPPPSSPADHATGPHRDS